jgi:hypothetical protein
MILLLLIAAAVRVDAAGGSFEVRDADGRASCQLPCVVEPEAGLHLQDGRESVPLDAIPADITAAQVVPGRAGLLQKTTAISIALAAAGVGILIAAPAGPAGGSIAYWRNTRDVHETLAAVAVVAGFSSALAQALLGELGLAAPQLRSGEEVLAQGSGSNAFYIGVALSAVRWAPDASDSRFRLEAVPMEFSAGLRLTEWMTLGTVLRISAGATLAGGVEWTVAVTPRLHLRAAALAARMGCSGNDEFRYCGVSENSGPLVGIGASYVARSASGIRYTVGVGAEAFDVYFGFPGAPGSTGWTWSVSGPRLGVEW